MPEFNILYTALMIGGVIAFVMTVVAYLILAERKVSAWVQDRIGPNRVGPFGLLQPLADGGKMFLKEEVIPGHVDKIFFVLAPMVAFATALLAIAVVPVGGTTAPPAPQANVAAFEAEQAKYQNSFSVVLAPGLDVASSSYALRHIGSLLAALWRHPRRVGVRTTNTPCHRLCSVPRPRSISYEIPLGMSIVGVLLFSGSLNLETIVAWQQSHGWNVWFQPLRVPALHDQRLRRVQPVAVRPARGGTGTGWRLSHRILEQHETRSHASRRIRPHDHHQFPHGHHRLLRATLVVLPAASKKSPPTRSGPR